MSANDGGPAFPVSIDSVRGGADWLCGMTLRDYAEIAFTAAWIAALGQRHGQEGYSDISAADEAQRLGRYQADAMIADRAPKAQS